MRNKLKPAAEVIERDYGPGIGKRKVLRWTSGNISDFINRSAPGTWLVDESQVRVLLDAFRSAVELWKQEAEIECMGCEVPDERIAAYNHILALIDEAGKEKSDG